MLGLPFTKMNDFQTINEIVNESVRNSSYVTVIISSCVFVVYTLIIRLIDYFKSKDKSKPLLEMAAALRENTTNIVKLNQVLDKQFQDAEKKESTRIDSVIGIAFDSFRSAILTQCIDIIIHNNIDANPNNIKQTIYKTVTTEYYKVYSVFALYEHKGINLATRIKEGWIDDITKECFQVIYNNEDNATRIRQIDNKLIIDTEQYSIYVNNKVFNH